MVRTVLIVDDDRTLVDMLVFMLKRFGFEARAAGNGMQALDILHAERIDLVVLDVMLPDIDGFEVCRRIRAIPRIGRVPILMLSARAQVADRVAGLEAGADDYIAKPVVIKEIIDRIRTYLSRAQRSRDEEAPVITLLGAKGGVGCTTTAVNLVLALVAAQKRVVLLDLGAAGLTAAWMLGLQPAQTLLGLSTSEGRRFTMNDLQTCVLTHASGLHYLPGHPRAFAAAPFRAGTLAEALNLLQLHYDAIIVDLGVGGVPANIEALTHTTSIVLIAERDGLCPWHLRALVPWLEQNKLKAKLAGLVFVEGFPIQGDQTPAVLAQEATLELLVTIPPASEALYQAHRHQTPLLLNAPETAPALAYSELSRRITRP